MTYHDRTELAEYKEPSQEHVRFIASVIQRAGQVWTAGAPEPGNELANDLAARMKWKKRAVIDYAFQSLKNEISTNFFPKPPKWQKALDFAEEILAERGFKSFECADLQMVDFNGRIVPLYEKNVHEFVKIAEESEVGKLAIKEGWWGMVSENRVYEYGLSNYLAALFERQIMILHIWPKIGHSYGLRRIGEINENNFYEWMRSEEFVKKIKELGAPDMKIARREDIEEIRKHGLEIKEEMGFYLDENPGIKLQLKKM